LTDAEDFVITSGNVNMRLRRFEFCLWLCWGVALMGVLLSTGCRSTHEASAFPSSPGASTTPWVPPSLRTNLALTNLALTNLALTNLAETNVTTAVLRPGELVRVIYSDVPPPGILPSDVRIGENGKITLLYNITVQAAGKTPNQLQEDIRKEYVPRYFKHLTITIKTEERYYFVGGDVRFPNRFVYYGHITVLRAVATAGGYGEFADRKRIDLRRANGQIFKVNGKKAIDNPKLDLEVFPGDEVFVHRRFY